MNYGGRLAYARKLRGLSQKELADKAGVNNQSISKIENGNQVSSRYDDKLAKALKINPEWLKSGDGNMEMNVNDLNNYDNHRSIFLLNSNEVRDYVDHKQQPEQKTRTISPTRCTDRAFQMILTDDSMVSREIGEDSYPPGRLICADPGVTSTNGRKVVAAIEGVRDVIFRKVQVEFGQEWLIPLNSKYQRLLVDDKVKILATLVSTVIVEN